MDDYLEFINLNNAYKKPFLLNSIIIEFKENLTIEIKISKKNNNFLSTILDTYINNPFNFEENVSIYINKEKIIKNFKNKDEKDIEKIIKEIVEKTKSEDVLEIKYEENESGIESFYTNRNYIPYIVSKYKPDDYYLKKYLIEK